MILQEEFMRNGYTDLLLGNNARDFGIDLEDIFDLNQKPKELLNIYISSQGDELFFLLVSDNADLNSLSDYWDEKIRVFTMLNGTSKIIQKLKYNIVQLIICSESTPDKSREGNLLISRKIIIKGTLKDNNKVEITESEVIELPFYMIPPRIFEPDNKKLKRLNKLLPKDDDLFELLKKNHKKVNKGRNAKLSKSFKNGDYVMIKRWLEG